MRILVDYRPALRARTGVGEYIRQLVQAYTATHHDEVARLYELMEGPARTRRSAPSSALASSTAECRCRCSTISGTGRVAAGRNARRSVSTSCTRRIRCSFRPGTPPRSSPFTTSSSSIIPNACAARSGATIPSWRPRMPAVPTPSSRHRVRTQRLHHRATRRARGSRLLLPSGRAGVEDARRRAPNVPPDGYVLLLGTLEARKNVGVILDAFAHARAAGVARRDS